MEPNDPSSKGMKKKLTVAQSNFINKGMSKCSSPCQIYIISNHDSYFITIVDNVFCTKSSIKQVNKLSREPFRSPLSPLMNGNMIYLLINFCIIFNFMLVPQRFEVCN